MAQLSKVANIADAYATAHSGAGLVNTPEVDDGHTIHAPVGSFEPNGYGIYDMHGNNAEWRLDTYGVHGPEAVADPVNQGSGLRVSRGGSWYNPAHIARSSARSQSDPGLRHDNMGVRPARAVASD